jgi:hypothetical protein
MPPWYADGEAGSTSAVGQCEDIVGRRCTSSRAFRLRNRSRNDGRFCPTVAPFPQGDGLNGSVHAATGRFCAKRILEGAPTVGSAFIARPLVFYVTSDRGVND